MSPDPTQPSIVINNLPNSLSSRPAYSVSVPVVTECMKVNVSEWVCECVRECGMVCGDVKYDGSQFLGV